MSLFDSERSLTVEDEIVESFHSLIVGNADLITAQGIEEADHVFQHFKEDPVPSRYAIIRHAEPAGGSMETISGSQIIMIQVEVVVRHDQLNPQHFCSVAHDEIRSSIVNQKPTLTGGTLDLPYYRQTRPGAARYDETRKEWYSTALYYAVTKPI